MSLINDALKRVKEAQPQAAPPPVPNLQLRPIESAQYTRHTLGMILPAALAVAALFLLFFVWQSAQRNPDNISVWLALGWCYKRTGKLDRAIESLEEALNVEPNDALVHYNLACYWSLAQNKRQALNYLAKAFKLEDEYRRLVAEESDFDPLRKDPAFQALVRVTV